MREEASRRAGLRELVRVGPRELTLVDDSGTCTVRFSASGIDVQLPDVHRSIPWPEVLGVEITVPSARRRVAALYDVLDLLGPIPTEHGTHGRVDVVLHLRRSDVHVALALARHVSWRLEFAVVELLDFLGETASWRRLAEGDAVVAALEECAGAFPRRARLLRRVDLVGMERRLGGRGARRRVFRRYFPSSAPAAPRDGE